MYFQLRIKPTLTTSTTTSASTSTKNATRHLSSCHEKEKVKKREKREAQLEAATNYCIENNCKGFKAISSGLFPLSRTAVLSTDGLERTMKGKIS